MTGRGLAKALIVLAAGLLMLGLTALHNAGQEAAPAAPERITIWAIAKDSMEICVVMPKDYVTTHCITVGELRWYVMRRKVAD